MSLLDEVIDYKKLNKAEDTNTLEIRKNQIKKNIGIHIKYLNNEIKGKDIKSLSKMTYFDDIKGRVVLNIKLSGRSLLIGKDGKVESKVESNSSNWKDDSKRLLNILLEDLNNKESYLITAIEDLIEKHGKRLNK